jgi:hypothetical protein
MLRKVVDGVWWTGDADGLPAARVTHLEEGTSLRAAGEWWAAGQAVTATLAQCARELLGRHGDSGEQADAWPARLSRAVLRASLVPSPAMARAAFSGRVRPITRALVGVQAGLCQGGGGGLGGEPLTAAAFDVDRCRFSRSRCSAVM